MYEGDLPHDIKKCPSITKRGVGLLAHGGAPPCRMYHRLFSREGALRRCREGGRGSPPGCGAHLHHPLGRHRARDMGRPRPDPPGRAPLLQRERRPLEGPPPLLPGGGGPVGPHRGGGALQGVRTKRGKPHHRDPCLRPTGSPSPGEGPIRPGPPPHRGRPFPGRLCRPQVRRHA